MDTKTGFETHYLNETSADVYFICQSDDRQSEVRVPAHKIILASKSETFQTMFYGSLPEKGDVQLASLTASAFKEFLQMFYFNQVGVSMENVNDVVDLSKQYQTEHYRFAVIFLRKIYQPTTSSHSTKWLCCMSWPN